MKRERSRVAVSRRLVTLFVVVVIAALAAAYILLPTAAPPRERVFYIVTYHWGFAFYDQDFREVDKIVVSRGDRVTLYVIPAEALTKEAHEMFEERTIQRGIGQLPPNDHRIHEAMEEAEEAGLMNHSVTILELGINIPTDVSKVTRKASSIREALEMGNPGGGKVTFTADKVGAFNIMCAVPCGYGHAWMIAERALVVS